MNDDDQGGEPSPFHFLFGPPPRPLTPTEQLERRKRAAGQAKAALTRVKAARASLRGLDGLGFCDKYGHGDKAKKHLALLEDVLETAIAWPFSEEG